MDFTIPSKRTAAEPKEAFVAGRPKFTRIPKVDTLIQCGVPAEVIPTYCVLADHANNKTGLCWPKMESLAKTLNRSVRTIQRHLHLLRECGLIEFVERRRYKGKFSSYLYRILFHATTGHTRQVDKRVPNKRRTKQRRTPPKSPTKDVTKGYEWLFGDTASQAEQQAHDQQQKQKREKEAKRRREGFEEFFK
jgi:DNA-binding transcriptional ArsR family regulator